MTGAGDRHLFRVAVTLFAKVEAVDFRDAASIAERAVKKAVNYSRVPGMVHGYIPVGVEGFPPVKVVDVMESNCAIVNGYMKVEPSDQAYRQRGNDMTVRIPPEIVEAASGHTLYSDPPAGMSRARRWTCSVCDRSVVDYEGNIYGSATTMLCSEGNS